MLRKCASFDSVRVTRSFAAKQLSALTAQKLDADMDVSKLRVKQLKQILMERGLTCDGCLEKGDYVRRVQELRSEL